MKTDAAGLVERTVAGAAMLPVLRVGNAAMVWSGDTILICNVDADHSFGCFLKPAGARRAARA
jgi:hypothetical protein